MIDLLGRILDEDLVRGQELVTGIWPWFWMRGHMPEGRRLMARAAELEGPYRLDALRGLGTIAFRQGDVEEAERAFTLALSGVPDGDRRALATAHADLARVALRRGDFAEVRRHAEAGCAAAEGLEPAAMRMPLHLRAAAARMEGRLAEARELYLHSRELNEELSNAVMVASEDHNLVHVALHAGDLEEARRRFTASSSWIFGHDNAYLRPYSFLDAGILAVRDGDVERGCRLVALAQRMFDDSGAIPDPDDRVELDEVVSRLRSALSERFDALWESGRSLDVAAGEELARASK